MSRSKTQQAAWGPMFLGTKTICIGDRKSFLDRLDRALIAEDAVQLEVSREMVGSVVITLWEVRLADGTLFIEYDPFIGKSLIGPPPLVDRIAKLAFGVTDEMTE